VALLLQLYFLIRGNNRSTVDRYLFKWIPVVMVVGTAVFVIILLLHLLPGGDGLVLFGLYTVLSSVIITPFPQEPAILYYAKFYSPWVVTTIVTFGSCFSGLLDYWLLPPLLSHCAISEKFENSRFFQKALAFFRISPFWLLVFVNYSPIPLTPFRLLSIVEGYPLWKYEATLLVGRAPRYYMLAFLGYMLQPPTWALGVFALMLVVVSVMRNVFGRLCVKVNIQHDCKEKG